MRKPIMKKICFVSLNSKSLLSSINSPDSLFSDEIIGGAEFNQVLLGLELAKGGYDISFITYGDPAIYESYGNIRSQNAFENKKQTNFIKKIIYLLNALKKNNSDIYIHSSGSPGILPLFCVLHKKYFINWISSDRNVVLKNISKKTSFFTKVALFLDIKFADLILVQNSFQKEIIQKKFKKTSILIKNPVRLPDKDGKNGLEGTLEREEPFALWIGTVRRIKQPELFLDLAKKIPYYKFVMIGGRDPKDPEFYNAIMHESRGISNLVFLGFVPPEKIKNKYENASIFVNTSETEGFPNTFIEAWSYSLPVISLNIDPDELICNYRMGFHSRDFFQMVADAEALFHDEKLRQSLGDNGRKYVERYHDVSVVTDQFVKIIDKI